MRRAEVAAPTPNEDFWPAKSLAAWQADPRENFKRWLGEQRVLGTRTLRDSTKMTYCAMFDTWLQFLDARRLLLLEARTIDGTAFFEERAAVLHREEFTAVSRRRYLLLLDKVYLYLKGLGWPHPSPVSRELRKEGVLDVPLPPGLPADDQAKLLSVLHAIPGWKGERDRGLASLLLGAGLRTHELVSFEEDQVESDFQVSVKPAEGRVHKAHTSILLPDGPWRDWFIVWKTERAKLNLPEAVTVFCPATSKGKPFSPSGLFRRIGKWFDAAGISPEQRGANILRNTFARNALTCGRYDAATVSEFLGHTDTRATVRHLAQPQTQALLGLD